MTRDEIIKLAREADMIDFRDEDSDLHVVQFVDFLASIINKAVAAERKAWLLEMRAKRNVPANP